jgi:hypothetical protein
MHLKSVDGHAIATVNIPAHQQEVEVAYSAIDGCAVAAVEAWNDVRGENDARFEVCDPSYRSTLMAHAESVYKGAAPLEGDTMLALFEQRVANIRAEQVRAAFALAHPVVPSPVPTGGNLETQGIVRPLNPHGVITPHEEHKGEN